MHVAIVGVGRPGAAGGNCIPGATGGGSASGIGCWATPEPRARCSFWVVPDLDKLKTSSYVVWCAEEELLVDRSRRRFTTGISRHC